MLRSLCHWKRPCPLVFVLIGGLVIVAFGITRHSGTTAQLGAKEVSDVGSNSRAQIDSKFDVFKYLPPGASLRDPKRDVIFADLDRDGKEEVVIFYALVTSASAQAKILVLKFSDGAYHTLWENGYEPSAGFADPSGVYYLSKDQKPQIIAYRVVGASCPGVLDVYQCSNGTIERITGDWAGRCQSDLELKDLDGDGVPEIVFREQKYGSNPNVYRWNGREYIRSNRQFPQYYSAELQRVVGLVHSPNAFPAPTRVSWCRQAVEIYLIQKSYSEGIRLCKATLQIIDDPNLTTPNSTAKDPESVEQRNRIQISLEMDRAKGKADVYHLLGDIFRAAGDLQQSQEQYKTSQRFEAEAAQKSAMLLH